MREEAKPQRVIPGLVELCKGLAVNPWPHTFGSVQVLDQHGHNGSFLVYLLKGRVLFSIAGDEIMSRG